MAGGGEGWGAVMWCGRGGGGEGVISHYSYKVGIKLRVELEHCHKKCLKGRLFALSQMLLAIGGTRSRTEGVRTHTEPTSITRTLLLIPIRTKLEGLV